MRIAVISPHPDDETLGAGGTLLRYKNEGHQIFWINVTDVTPGEAYSKEFCDLRKQQIQKVCEFYGFDGFFNLKEEPAGLTDRKESELIGKISACIKSIQPDMLILPDKRDAHSDHGAVFRAAMACTKVFRCPGIKKIVTMEILSETDFGDPYSAFQPNYFVDITNYLQQKLEAMKIYSTELQEAPFPRNLDAIQALALLRGGTSGVKYAEAFHVIKVME